MNTVLPFEKPQYTASNFLACYLIQRALETQESLEKTQERMERFPDSLEAAKLLREAEIEEESARVIMQETANRLERYFGVSA
jgi:hypothetical protein|tara:strand:+ start:573 stop:821 length:249 start_codon:yes stop_codon:yes gene_type:complete